ncbi:MAG: hypothetical protein JSU67_07785 [Gammaproteobacteria bacterium]|nr:MAG: hypothetical protein EP300_10210 [Gammaproteobacteria bacterium]UCH41554.1 MAG: hypothetical protein JSU67_07785 [Gammaproteobacteria bacterium]
MKASEIFHKTAKGQSEVEARTNALSIKERRVLILVNGENNAARLKELSLCENIVEILETLLSGGFIAQLGGAAAAAAVSAPGASSAEAGPRPAAAKSTAGIGAREFMCNTLLTFANRVRVARLLEEINAAEDADSLKEMVKPWYQALSETPGGMYQADELRKEVNKMIADEESGGLR